jgi:ubiquinone/menaquinone biosynthesis C-methylase UbiE
MNRVQDHAAFEESYAGKAPWDIGRPQRPFVNIADRVISPLLDAGCGTGDTALFFAARGHRVTGIDFAEAAIRRARRKAAEQGCDAEFVVKDAMTLDEWDKRFATVIDSGLFHVFSQTDRQRYVQGVSHVLQQGGRIFLICFSDNEPGNEGPRRISRHELSATFAEGWHVESVQAVRVDVNPDFADKFSEGGPKAWFAIIRRGE